MVVATKTVLNRTSGPGTEPVSLVEARDQVELIASDTSHDTKLTRYIAAAREQVEDDTGYALITSTWTLSMTHFPGYSERLRSGESFIHLPRRPIQSIGSITYYDGADSQQTLSTDVYGLDGARRLVYLKYNQTWPAYTERHNGIVITFVAGYTSATAVPYVFKQLILLQVAKWFEHRGDESKMPAHDTAYERLLRTVVSGDYYIG